MGNELNVDNVMAELAGALRGTQTGRLKDVLNNLDSEWESMGFQPGSRSRDIVRRCIIIEIKRRGEVINAIEPVKSESFGNIRCDFYRMDDELWMTREQIGSALGYSEPRKAVSDIHNRHKKRLDKFSTVRNLLTVEGNREVSRDVIMYNARGIYEICRWSQQPKADEFFDWVYDVLEGLRKGELMLHSRSNALPACTGQPEGKYIEAQAKLLDARTRQARLLMTAADKFKDSLTKEEIRAMVIRATDMIKHNS